MPKVESLNLNFQIESGTDPFVIGDVNNLIFCFLTVSHGDDGNLHDSGLAVFRTKSSLLYKHGYPNDEAISCSALIEHGFDGYSISKVIDSDWIQEISNKNDKKWRSSDYFSHFSHWVFPFKETTLEIIAMDLDWYLTDKSYSQVQSEMLAWIYQNQC